MEVRIGVTYTAREIEIDLGESANADTVQSDFEAALANDGSVFWLTDRRGRKVGVPAGKISYIEIGTNAAAPRMGFVG